MSLTMPRTQLRFLMFIAFIRGWGQAFGLDSAATNPSGTATIFGYDFQASIQLYGQSLPAG